MIGKGGFGKVWKVEYKKTKQVFAMKEMNKAKLLKKFNYKNFIIWGKKKNFGKKISSFCNERAKIVVIIESSIYCKYTLIILGQK